MLNPVNKQAKRKRDKSKNPKLQNKNSDNDSNIRQKISPVAAQPDQKFFVYLLLCSDNTLYCGSTTDLVKRLHAHNNLKSAAKYTRARRPVVLVYHEELPTFSAMRAREGEIKRMPREGKFKLYNFI